MRLIFSIVLVFTWVVLVIFGRKTHDDYFLNMTAPLQSEESVDWRNEEKKIKFYGFSGEENGYRWSEKRSSKICFVHPESDRRIQSAKISIDVTLIDGLVNKPILLKNRALSVDNFCNETQCTLAMPVSIENDRKQILCTEIVLPLTVNVIGDSRDLGFRFHRIKYSY